MTEDPINRFRRELKVEGYPSLGQVLRRRRRSLKDYIKEQGVETGDQVIPYLESLLQSVREFSYEEDFFEALPDHIPPRKEFVQVPEEPSQAVESLKSSPENKKKKGKASPVSETPTQEELDVPSESESSTKE